MQKKYLFLLARKAYNIQLRDRFGNAKEFEKPYDLDILLLSGFW